MIIGSISGLIGAATPITLALINRKQKDKKDNSKSSGNKSRGSGFRTKFIVVPLLAAGVLFFVGYKSTGLFYTHKPLPAVTTELARDTSAVVLPEISLSEQVVDENGTQINLNSAPFIIRVQGRVTKAKKYFTYLVVNDFNADWVEPRSGLGAGVDNEFSGFCYLGEKDPRGSLRNYEVYAVVTNREYQEYEHLDRSTVLAYSNRIQLRRTR